MLNTQQTTTSRKTSPALLHSGFPAGKGIMLISDRQVTGTPYLCERLLAAMQGGVAAVQLREKDLDDTTYTALFTKLRNNRIGRIPLIVNRRAHLVRPLGADGIHIGAADLDEMAELRRLMPAGTLVGVSCHSEQDVARSDAAKADYVTVGPMAPTASKPDAKQFIAVETVAQWQVTYAVPIYPLGGVDEAVALQLYHSGVQRAACVRAGLEGENDLDVVCNVLALRRELGLN